jgi:penicillin-binding protein 2
MEVRNAAINALAGHAGTVVVMEPQTGKVLSIVNQDWAIRKGFKPCSTVKLVTAEAGINEKVIDSSGTIQTRRFPMNLDDALAHSNNSYFQTVGASLGSEKLISYAKALGLGEQTGINAENESPGRLPYGNNNAKIYSHGEDFEVTAVQLAVVVSAISNGGKIVVPQTPKTKIENANFRGYMRKEVQIPQNNLQRVLPGMLGAVNYGTATRASDGTLNIAGKTGSCIGQGSWLGLFASVSPVVNPKLAVIVITRGSGERGKYASAIAGNIYKSLSHRFNDGRDFTAKVPLELRPQQKITAKNSANLDNDAGEESDADSVNQNTVSKKPNPKKGGEDIQEINTVTVKDTKNSAPKNSTKSTTGFDPVVIQINREQTRPRVVPMKNN